MADNSTLVIAVPSKAYVSSLLALGILKTKFNQSLGPKNKFETIADLPKDTPILLNDNGTLKWVLFKEVQEAYGRRFLRVLVKDTQKNESPQYRLFTETSCSELYPGYDQPQFERAAGTAVNLDVDFANKFYNVNNFLGLIADMQTSTAIIGSAPKIRNDLENFKLRIKAEDYGESTNGTLYDLLMPKDAKSSKVGLIQLISTINIEEMELPKNSILIFDGSLPYLKHFEMFSDYRKLVILDKSESNFSTAVSTTNQRLLTSLSGKLPAFEKIPAGVEMCFFGSKHG